MLCSWISASTGRSGDVDEMTPFVDYAYPVGGSEYTGMFVPTDPSNPYDGEVRKKLLGQYKTDDKA